MLTIFKYIDYARKAKQGYHAPEELLADTSFGFVEGFFIAAFVVTALLSGGLLFLGFFYGFLLFKILGVIAVLALAVEITIYIVIKRAFKTMSKRVVDSVQNNISRRNVRDVETHEQR